MINSRVQNVGKKKYQSNTKLPGRHGRQMLWMTDNILYLVNKNPSPNSWPDVEQCPGERWIHVQGNNQEKDQEHWGTLHHRKYRGFTKRCKLLIASEIAIPDLALPNNVLKRLYRSWATSYGQRRQKSSCTRVMGRKEYREGKELLMIQSIPPNQWIMVVVVSWCGHAYLSILFSPCIYWWWGLPTKATGWILKIFRLYYHVILNLMVLNSLDNASQCRWTMTQSFIWKPLSHFYPKKVEYYSMAQSITSPEYGWASISLAGGKTEGKIP